MSDQCWHCFELFNQNALQECQDCGFDYCLQCIQNHNEQEEEEIEEIYLCNECGQRSKPKEWLCPNCELCYQCAHDVIVEVLDKCFFK